MARRTSRPTQAVPRSITPLEAILAGIQQDEAEKAAGQDRINNIRRLQMELMRSLESAGLRSRSLDLQELRMMNQ